MKNEISSKKGDSVNVIIYCRISAPIPNQGASIESRKAYCYEYCEKRGWRIEKVFTDEGASNNSMYCNQFKDALSYCTTHQSRISALVVYSFDRISRDEQDYCAVKTLLSKLDILFISATHPPDGSPEEKFIRIMVEALNKQKAISTRMRVEAAIQKIRSKGKLPGPAPIGYRSMKQDNNDCEMIVDPEGGPLINEAFEMYATGGYSLKDVCDRINLLGFQNQVFPKPMTIQKLIQLLRNRTYVGDVFVNDEVGHVPSAFKPLVCRTVFKTVQDILRKKEKVFGKDHKVNRDPYSYEIITCHRCGNPETVSMLRCKRNKRLFEYTCNNKKCQNYRKQPSFPKLEIRLEERHPETYQFG